MTAIEAGHVRTEIRLEGVFDIAAARRVAAALDEARYADVRIDLTAVREFHDFAVVLLGETVASRHAPTEVVGLQEQHRRLLRNLGVDGADADRTGGAALR
jgi:anti-anti-sigma regulatory factor